MERMTIEALSRGDKLYTAPPTDPTEAEVQAWLDGIWRFHREDRLVYLESTTNYWREIASEAEARWKSSPEHLVELNMEAAAQTVRWLEKHLRDIDELRSGIPPVAPRPLLKAFVRAHSADERR